MIKLITDFIMFIIFFTIFFYTKDIASLIISLFFVQEFRAEINVLRIEEKINEYKI